jgi:hypothetical protein
MAGQEGGKLSVWMEVLEHLSLAPCPAGHQTPPHTCGAAEQHPGTAQCEYRRSSKEGIQNISIEILKTVLCRLGKLI